MAHTLICHKHSLKENQEKTKRNVFKFHLFIPHTFYLQSQICSELRRDKKYKKDQRFGFGGLLGVRFKFVISHVQVNIKMLLVHCFCRQHRFGAGQTPCSLLNFLKKGLGNWQASLLVNAVSTALNFLLQLFAFSVYQLVGRRKSNCGSLPSCACSLLCLKSHLLYVLRIATPHSHSYDFCLDWLFCSSNYPPYVSHSLSVSSSESDHCTGLSFPFRWAYSMIAV